VLEGNTIDWFASLEEKTLCHFKQMAGQKYSLILGGGRITQAAFSGVPFSTVIRHGQFLSTGARNWISVMVSVMLMMPPV